MHRKILPILSIFILITACRLVTPFTTGPTQIPGQIAPLPSQTFTPIPPIPTLASPTLASIPEPTSTPEPPMPFSVLAGAPLYSLAFLHDDLGCAWMGVAGQVFGLDGAPLSDLVVSLTGSLAGRAVDSVGYTGAATGYGPGGFEIKLSDQAQVGVFWIQLHDLEGRAVSNPFAFEMSGSCEQNLAIINFIQAEGEYELVLPMITR